jgi:hypothetical protein
MGIVIYGVEFLSIAVTPWLKPFSAAPVDEGSRGITWLPAERVGGRQKTAARGVRFCRPSHSYPKLPGPSHPAHSIPSTSLLPALTLSAGECKVNGGEPKVSRRRACLAAHTLPARSSQNGLPLFLVAFWSHQFPT